MARVFGKKSFRAKLSPERMAVIEKFRPLMSRAAKFAENNKRNHGVLSVPTANAGEASDVLNNSVINNFARWDTGMPTAPWRPNETRAVAPKYLDFFQKRWAPIGAENDPDNLNKNWAPNARWYIKNKTTPEEYQALEELNLVMNGGTLEHSSAVV
jgi:hypothetical protein